MHRCKKKSLGEEYQMRVRIVTLFHAILRKEVKNVRQKIIINVILHENTRYFFSQNLTLYTVFISQF